MRLTSDSDSLRKRVRRSLESQTRPTVTVLSSLLAAHDELGYLPDEAIEEVAAYNEASINDVWGVASFYTNFRFTPPAERIVEVCWGPTCHLARTTGLAAGGLRGATDILLRVQEELGLTDEGETSDNKVTLKYNTCLGACSQAPVMSVDHHLKGRVTADTAGETVGLLRDR